VAPNIYTGIFGDEAPPDDLVKSADQQQVMIPAASLTLNDQ
jgi:hypothetical protein